MKAHRLIFFLLSCMGLAGTLSSQSFSNNREVFRLHAHHVSDGIVVDGILNEETWKEAEVATEFYRVLPIDTGFAASQTEVYISYDDQTLYMAIVCHDTVAGKRPAESLRRDFSFGKNDNFLVFIDTYNDQTNGFSFGISASGAQWDGLQANGGFVSLDWDCKWRSAIYNDAKKWVAEFAIPFRSIRYQEGVREWGINFSRLDLKTNEKSSWAPVPRQFQTANLAFTGTLIFDDAPPKLGARFSMIPYVSARTSRNVALDHASDFSGDAGIDAKVTLSTSLNLDLTVNPDFSQVDVDRQVTNLDRFELFFPERRQFFLENSDLFASLGSENIRPFFSRRIGLDSPVQAGMRLSGKVGDLWRVGLMNIQTGRSSPIDPANFTVAAVQRKVLDRSNIGAFVVNKLNTAADVDHFNRVVGVDFNFASKDSRWVGKAFYHRSNTSDASAGSAASVSLEYATQRFSMGITNDRVGQHYSAETGFVRRENYFRMNPMVGYKFFPASSALANHGPSLDLETFLNLEGDFTDRNLNLDYSFQWLSRSSLSAQFTHSYVRLLAPFDPTNTSDERLPEGSEYTWSNISLEYNSNARRLFNYSVGALIGGHFHGSRFSLISECNYRVQPYGSLGLVGAFNRLMLPAPYGDVNLFLLGPKLDLTFTDKIFLTTFLQYNSQIENVNLNVRFQWRYAPVSDLFIVYTSNTNTAGFGPLDRALVAKLSYYFN